MLSWLFFAAVRTFLPASEKATMRPALAASTANTVLSAVPVPDPYVEEQRHRIILEGDIPSPMNPPSGCRFHPRCPYATDVCKVEEPPLREVEKDHFVACHLAEKFL